MRIGDPGEHASDLGEVQPPVGEGAGEQFGQCVPFRGDPLCLAQRLADETPAPQREPPAQSWVRVNRRANARHGEVRMPRVVEHLEHETARVVVHESGDLPVEVRRDAVPHVRLDQALEPVARCGPAVELLERLNERDHRGLRLHAELDQAAAQPLVMMELGDRHRGELAAVLEARRQPGVLGQPFEGGQLPERQHAKQVHNRGPVPCSPVAAGVLGEPKVLVHGVAA